MENGFDKTRRRSSIIIAVLAVVGIALSGELLRIHLTVEHDPGHDFACKINEAMNCNVVAQSKQSEFLYVPVPIWGILTYLAFLGIGIIGFFSKQEPGKHLGDYTIPMSIWCVVYSAYLAYVSAIELETFCLYCAGLYGVNLLLFIVSIPASRPLLSWWHRRVLDWNWLMADLSRFGAASFVFVILLGIVSGYYAWQEKKPPAPVVPGVAIDIKNDPAIGPFRTPVTIIELSDFECPACRQMHKTTKKLLEKYKGSIRLVHKNFPLDSRCNSELNWHMHPNSCEAAAAAECAFKAGKFEAYSERLWQARDLSVPSLVRIAEEEGLDSAAFQECMGSEEIKRAIHEDVEAGSKLEIEGTPTFIVRGESGSQMFTGIRDLEGFSRVIDDVLAGKSVTEE